MSGAERMTGAEEANGEDSPSAPGTFRIGGVVLSAPPAAPGLHVVATPIGNLADITLRALQTLAGVELILAEDTRQTRKLLQRYRIRAKTQAYHEHNAARMRPRVLRQLENGASIALVSDAGTPLVSDPGVRLARAVREQGLPLHVLPGPSAVIAALVASGLASERFMFAGFIPAKAGARRRFLEELKGEQATLILFESPHRIKAALSDMAEVFGPRMAALCRELTKLHEEVIRLPLPELAQEMALRESIRGEIVIVVAPPGAAEQKASRETLEQALREALRESAPSRAAADIARRFGRPKREIYELALRISRDREE